MKIQLVFLVFFAILLLSEGLEAGELKLKSPYNVLHSQILEENANCPKTPKPVKNLVFKSIYTNRDHGLSIVDKKAQKKYKKQTRPIRRYEQKISGWVEEYQTNGQNLECAIQWLVDWAKQDALLDKKVTFQGQAVRKWTLGVLSSAYVQIQSSPQINKNDKKIIEDWLHLLSEQVISDYSQHPEKRSRRNNHIYWSAWAVMITSVITQERNHYLWAHDKFELGLNEIDEDGTLPLEIYREGKAFNYHVFALGPLIMMAETLEASGQKGYTKALHKLVQTVLKGLENDQSYFEEKTGVKQDLKGTITAPQLAWIEVYHARFPNKITKKWVEKLRPFNQRRLGGNLTRLFAKDYSEEG